MRHLRETPLVFAGHMWQGLADWPSTWMLRPRFELANPEDMQIPVCVERAEQAVAVIRGHYARWMAAQGKHA